MSLEEWAATAPRGGPANEVNLELELREVLLRDFTFALKPLRWGSVTDDSGRIVTPVRGLELEATARDTGLRVSLRFERGEFVNLATAGLAGLDAADEQTRGGEI